MLKSLPHYTRFRQYDYSRGASLFITIVTEPRCPRFGRVVDAKVQRTAFGEAVAGTLQGMPARVPEVRLFGWVVMPDHVHFNVHVAAGLPKPLVTLGKFVGQFKGLTTHFFYGQGGQGKLWQQGYHDRLCCTRDFIDATERYIAYNPLKYELRHNHPEYLAIREPLQSFRLDDGDYWRGIGAMELLTEDREMLSLRVSRQVASPAAAGEVVRRIRKAAERFTVISGFISPGERAVLAMLLAEPKAKVIRMLPDAMPHDYLPGSAWLPAIHERRAAVIALGNDFTGVNRAVCLALNDEIAKMARAYGMAVYWKAEGPERLA